MRETKTLEAKVGEEGRVTAVIATLGVIDHDEDVSLAGTFQEGAAVLVSEYGHSAFMGNAPVGKGAIRVDGNDVIAEAQYFMDTTRGREAFLTVKNVAELQQWSYGYDVVEFHVGPFEESENVRYLDKVDAFEISPVLRGAGIDTRTVDVKGAEGRTFIEQAALATAEVEALIERSKALAALRAKEGRVLSAANRTHLSATLDALKASGEALAELLAASDPNRNQAAFAREYARSMRLANELER